MPVITVLLELEQQILGRLLNVMDRGAARPGENFATRGGAVEAGVEVAVAVKQQIEAAADASGKDRQRRAGSIRIVRAALFGLHVQWRIRDEFGIEPQACR